MRVAVGGGRVMRGLVGGQGEEGGAVAECDPVEDEDGEEDWITCVSISLHVALRNGRTEKLYRRRCKRAGRSSLARRGVWSAP